jgi:hypothetical protein
MKYLYNELKPMGKYHLWNGSDTSCRMWSTGGLKQSRPGWVFVEKKPERDFSQMCMVNKEKGIP